jgi:2Fe-2S ferredoxin
MSGAEQVTWILRDGTEVTAAVTHGVSLMEAARAACVPGIAGECGGALSCATCHVVIVSAGRDVGPPGPVEDDMLDMTEAEREPASRLSCQMLSAPGMGPLLLRVP